MNVCLVFLSSPLDKSFQCPVDLELVYLWCKTQNVLFICLVWVYIFFLTTDNVFFVVRGLCVWGDFISGAFSLRTWPCLHMFSISKVRQRQVDNASKLHATLPWQGRTLFANSLEVGDTYSWLMDRPLWQPRCCVYSARWRMSATWTGRKGAGAEKNGFCASKHSAVERPLPILTMLTWLRWP